MPIAVAATMRQIAGISVARKSWQSLLLSN
jgi:hypothetical protein